MTAFTKEWSKQNILIEEMEEESVDTSSEGDFGSATGYSDELLYWAGGVPNLNIGNLGNLFKEHFGEKESDTEYVRLGVERFYKQYGNKYPATI